MSAVPQAAGKPPAPKKRWEVGDHEFLPAAVEILETPPSPIRIWLLVTICAFVVITLVWAWFGRIDIVASAQGKIQPLGSVKVIQPIETGRVREVAVVNGKSVKAGDVLVRLDPSEAEADVRGTRSILAAFRAEATRRRTSIAALQKRQPEPIPAIQWPEGIPDDLRARETRVLTGELTQVAAVVASLEAQRRQKQAEVERLRSTIEGQKDLIKIQKERVGMRTELVERGAGPRANLLDALESMRYQETVLITQTGQLAESEANIEVLGREIGKIFEAFVSDNSQKLADAEKQIDDYEQRLAKAEVRLERMTLTSPIDGTIQSLTVSTVGQVVTTGVELMRVVPLNAAVEIECYLPNKDIGFVSVGQDAVIKIDAFPFTRYGSINAKVIRIAKDAMPEPEAQALEGNMPAQKRPSMFATPERTQNLVYPITLAPETTQINADGVMVPLSPGMSVTAEVKTGSRRILEFVFSPLVELGSKSMKER